ncbi:MAG: DNA-processing protein DprA [Thermodesulfobacteriota bacterium]
MEEAGVRLITLFDPEYPASLKEIPEPPILLYARGQISTLTAGEAVAIVGTRRPTHYGQRVSESLGGELASLGAVIVSGMARGCDMAAHKGALGAGGATVAVLGTGIDRCYPPEARGLYDEIGTKGLLLSEFPMGAGPKPYNFPRRNRIISGLSRGVIVVEAPLRSGAMMTSRLSLEYNRDVFAVPGPITSYKSKGPNSLIKSGAMPVEDAGDIFSAWGLEPGSLGALGKGDEEGRDKGAGVPAEGNEAIVFKTLEEGPLSIDAIASASGLKVHKLGGILLEMELKGLISQSPGKVFTRRF